MIILQRYTDPTRYDMAEYGQLCKHGDKYFIQVSKNPDLAHWLTLGAFLEVCYESSILSDDFISECLSRYESKTSSTDERCLKQEEIL